MRALRDFNTPKIVTDDVPIFMGLIGDLFPALNVPRKRDIDFETFVKNSVIVSLYTRARNSSPSPDKIQTKLPMSGQIHLILVKL